MAVKMDKPIVSLHNTQTQVEIDHDQKRKAIGAAYYATLSAHEHVWNEDEQYAMALYCLWAYQRLSAIGQCVNEDLEHSGPRPGMVEINRDLAVSADSEFSAVAHGRPPSDKQELLAMSDQFRKAYEIKAK